MRGVPTPRNTYQAATTQAVKLGVEVKVDNREPGPQKFEARARTGAAEQERVKARQRLAEDQAATGPSVRVCVLFGPAKAAQLRGVFGLAFPPGFPMAAHSLSYGSSLCRSHRPPTTGRLWAVAPIAQEP
jgi:hypothetical protein